MSEQRTTLLQAASLHQIEICIAQNKPFCASRLKIHLNPRVCTLSLTIKNDPVTKFSVPHALTKPDTEFATSRGLLGSARR